MPIRQSTILLKIEVIYIRALISFAIALISIKQEQEVFRLRALAFCRPLQLIFFFYSYDATTSSLYHCSCASYNLLYSPSRTISSSWVPI